MSTAAIDQSQPSVGATTATSTAVNGNANGGGNGPVLKGSKSKKKKGKKKGSSSKHKDSKLQYVWFLGHAAILVTSGLEVVAYCLFLQKTFVARLIYRLVFLFAVLTYGLALRKLLGKQHGKRGMPLFAVLHVPTFQYGSLAAFWLISRHHLLKLTPYFVYSLLQTADYASRKVIKDKEKKAQIESHLNNYAHVLMKIVAESNLLLLLRLLFDVLTIKRGSGVSFVVYTFYFRLAMTSSEGQKVLYRVEDGLDKMFNHPKSPAKVKDLWKKLKWFVDHHESYALTPEQKKKQELIRQLDKEKEKLDEKKLPTIAPKREESVDIDASAKEAPIKTPSASASTSATPAPAPATTPAQDKMPDGPIPQIQVDDTHANGNGVKSNGSA